jgi:hypothetical protein
MSEAIYVLLGLLLQLCSGLPVGTQLGIYQILCALLGGRFLGSRGALFPALASLGLSAAEVSRASGALRSGCYHPSRMVDGYHELVLSAGIFAPNIYEGYRPVACDLTGFFRPHLRDLKEKHYTSKETVALPALVYGVLAPVGTVSGKRMGIMRSLVRRQTGESEPELMRRLIRSADLGSKEALIADSGFPLPDLLSSGKAFVARLRENATARRGYLTEPSGAGRHPIYGRVVRPLAHTYKKHTLAATEPDEEATFMDGRHCVRLSIFRGLVSYKHTPGSPEFTIVVARHPRFEHPLVLATNLSVSGEAVWRLYHDRWPIEQIPLAAKQMLGCQRQYVFAKESRWRLPELAMLAGNLLSYVAANSKPVASGFWDRNAKPTCGRLRRVLERLDFSKLAPQEGQLRKKNSVTAHLKTGVNAHRRHKTTAMAA